MARPPSNVAAASVSFTKAFVPGLVIGLIIGAFAGAFITPLLDRGGDLPLVEPPGTPQVEPGSNSMESMERGGEFP